MSRKAIKAERQVMNGERGRITIISIIFTATLFGITILLLSGGAVSGENSPPAPVSATAFRAAPLDLSANFLDKPITEKGTYKFGSKDTFSSALRSMGAPGDAVTEVVSNIGNKCGLDRISRGQRMDYEFIEGLGLKRFSISCGIARLAHVELIPCGADRQCLSVAQSSVRYEEIPHVERERAYACVVLKNYSLIGSAALAGISEGQVMEVAKIFRSDIDFNNDIHPGDEFKILVKEIQDLEGNALAPGDILAAEIVSQDKEHWAIWYSGTEGKGFFDLKGTSLVKTFLRSPLPFLSVSSGFTMKRFHPILGKTRPHLGVDFAAPTGTSVMAAASGRVIEAGRESGYGNVIKVRHGNLMTLYAHLSKIKVRRGQYVRQGQVIGAVGATGLATGPHLHYGMYRNNVAIDPMSVKMDTAMVLYSTSFRAARDHAVEMIKNKKPANAPR